MRPSRSRPHTAPPPPPGAEIFSYILSGGLDHTDSMGNKETLGRGHVQFTSGGTGISHSEFNADRTPGGRGQDVRFLQIWAVPDSRGLKPAYQTGHWRDELKRDRLCPILEPAASPTPGSGALKINNGLRMLASILSPGAALALPLPPASKAYVHVPAMPGAAGVAVSAPGVPELALAPGDGAFVEGCGELSFRGLGEAAVPTGGGGVSGGSGSSGTEFVVMHFPK
jgi:redox-sensitive bicupin YhaK (pirin superfamily)